MKPHTIICHITSGGKKLRSGHRKQNDIRYDTFSKEFRRIDARKHTHQQQQHTNK